MRGVAFVLFAGLSLAVSLLVFVSPYMLPLIFELNPIALVTVALAIAAAYCAVTALIRWRQKTVREGWRWLGASYAALAGLFGFFALLPAILR